MDDQAQPTRRQLVRDLSSLTAGLLVGVALPWSDGPHAAEGPNLSPPANPLAFVRIAPDNTVTVLVQFLDKGQGIATGMATLVADELDADWSQMRVAFAPADVSKYANLLIGVQGTGSSTAVRSAYLQMRKAGAAARAMLIAAAAATWRVSAREITVERGVLLHRRSGRKSTFGQLAVTASRQSVPPEPTLKSASAFKLIGRDRLPRLDSVAKTTGRPVFGHDLRRVGMLYAMVVQPPRFGATVAKFDATKAKTVDGVVDVLSIGRGVAVIAKNSWAAIKARQLVDVSWDESQAEKRGTAELITSFKQLSEKTGMPAMVRGDAQAALDKADRRIEATYTFPYLAHAPMEPENVLIELTADGARMAYGSQFQTVDQGTAAFILGLKPEQVQLETTWAGASFGRRANPAADFVVLAALTAKALNRKNQPIQLLFTREDDIRSGYYRPMVVHRITAGLDAQGRLAGWRQHVVGQAISEGTAFAQYLMKNGVDETAVEGAADVGYAIPDFLVEATQPKVGVPVLWWRSVGHSHSVHAVESFIDELAHAAGRDAVAFRRDLLKGSPRHLAVLNAAANAIGWGQPRPTGTGVGIAVQASYGSYTAHAAEVRVDKGVLQVLRIVCAIDCGVAVNPDIVRAQAEGGAVFGLGAALKGRITLTDGRVDQGNFDTYDVVRMSEVPSRVDVIIIPSRASPGGVGEPVVPGVAPAVSNAIFAATGKRLRDLPFDLQQA